MPVLEFFAALIGVYTLVFLAMAVVPVDPARAILGPLASIEAVSELRSELGLDQPLHKQYVIMLGRVASGKLGTSVYYQRPVASLLGELMPLTIARAFGALAFGVVFGAFVARLAPRHLRSPLRWLFAGLQSVPAFALMLILMWLASALFNRTPLNSPVIYELLTIGGSAAFAMGATALFILDRVWPQGPTAPYTQFLEMLNLPTGFRANVLLRDSLPTMLSIAVNALTPTITAVAFAELIFGVRGIGLVFFRSCERGDLPVVVAVTLVLAIGLLLLQRIGDVVLRRLDPRIDDA